MNLRVKDIAEFTDNSSKETHATAHNDEISENPESRGVLEVSREKTNHNGSGIRWHLFLNS